MAATTEFSQVSADRPESRHVSANRPESCQITTHHPEFSHFLSATSGSPRSVRQYSRLASSMEDPLLMSASAAGISKPMHSCPSFPELIPLSVALPMGGIVLRHVRAAHITTEPFKAAASTMMFPEVAADAAEEVVVLSAVSPEAMVPTAVSPEVAVYAAEPPDAGSLRFARFSFLRGGGTAQQCTLSLSCRGRRDLDPGVTELSIYPFKENINESSMSLDASITTPSTFLEFSVCVKTLDPPEL